MERVPRRRRRMRCPRCSSLKTAKNGKRMIRPGTMDRHSNRDVQKYRCKECSRVFSLRADKGGKHGFDFKSELVRMHVEESMNYLVMSKRLKEKYELNMTPICLCRMVNTDCKRKRKYRNCLAPIELCVADLSLAIGSKALKTYRNYRS